MPKHIHESRITFVAEKLGGKGVAELERLATALYVTQQDPASSFDERIKKLTAIKPHISTEQASIAVEEVDRMIEAAIHTLVGND